jgi:2-alkenal reductase
MRRNRSGMIIGLTAVALLCVAGMIVLALALGDSLDGDPSPTSIAETRQQPFRGTPIAGEMTNRAPRAELPTAVEVVDLVEEAVVTVYNMSESEFGRFNVTNSSGTGFVISSEGYIVTNQHVVDGGSTFVAVFADGTSADATLVGADPITDLAVIKVDVPTPAIVPLGDSNALRPGQPVLAIGSPLGEFTNTVTQGVVSALGRSLTETPGQPALTGLIQHDAAINPGNSGGPLFNFAGEVVGVNTLGIQRTPDRDPAQGLYFAIPANTVREIAGKLIETGVVEYPYLGIETLSVTPEIAGQNDLPVDYGVFVVRVVPDGPAEAAGLEAGDLLLSIDGERIGDGRSFTEVLFDHSPGERVALDVLRGDDELTVDVTLGERPVT